MTRLAAPPLDAGPTRLLGIGAIVAAVVATMATSAGPLIIAAVVDHGITGGDAEWVLWGTLMLAGASIVNMASSGLEARWAAAYAHQTVRRLRNRVLGHMYSLDLGYFETEKQGGIMARATTDLLHIQQFLEGGVPLIARAALSLMIAVAVMGSRSVILTLVTLSVTVPLIAATIMYRRVLFGAEVDVRDRVADLLGHVNESLLGVRVIQAHAIEDHRRHVFADVNAATYAARMRSARATTAYYPIVELLPSIAFAVVLGYGATLVQRGDISLGTVVAFTLYVNHLFGPLQQLTEVAPILEAARAGRHKVAGFLARDPQVAEAPDAEPLEPGPGAVRADSLRFRYPDADHDAVAGVSLLMAPGERVALVGESGAGKTTLAKLLGRFYDPHEGCVVIDGQDLRNVAGDSLRSGVVLVPQEGYLFDGTIADNIALAKPGASRLEIEHACASIGALRHFQSLPAGLDTAVEAGGGSLSSGERQLVTLARATLAEPRLMLLDEATANVDPGTAVEVERAFAHATRGRTTVVIAHRAATALAADRVVFLEGGVIVEDGAPHALLAQRGAFAAWVAASGQGLASTG